MKDFSLDFIALNAHSSVRLEAENGLVLRVDPFRIGGEPHDADVIFFTHSHFDHFSPGDVEKVRKPETVFVAPASMSGDLKKAGLLRQAVLMRPGEETAVCGVPALAVPSYNTNKPNYPKENGWLGYVLTVRGLCVYIAGDTDDTEDARIVSCDVALLPVGGTYTMDAREAAACVNAMHPVAAIPTHYGCIVGSSGDGETFRKLVDSEIHVALKL